MPEWLAERGIGETRYALVERGVIVEARVMLDGVVLPGTVLPVVLIRSGKNGVARDSDGNEYLLPGGAPRIAEGATFEMEVTRTAIPGAEPWKRPMGKVATPGAAQEPCDSGDGALPEEWNDLIDEARTGVVRFNGGELRLSPTPAMTLIDVDGYLPPRELAQAGAEAAACAIRRLDIGGSIGIDLPTVTGKAERQAIGDVIDRLLSGPFERTAMNGFGFVQIVRPRRRASLLELAQDRAPFEARALLRQAGGIAGSIRLAAHPAVSAVLAGRPEWLDQLAHRVGGKVSLRADPSLAMSGGYAEPA